MNTQLLRASIEALRRLRYELHSDVEDSVPSVTIMVRQLQPII